MLMSDVSLVIVAELNVVGVTIGKPKADAPLVVHCDRVLTMPIGPERVKAITPWHLEVVESTGEMHILKFTNRATDQIRRQPLGPSRAEKIIGTPIRERFDHVKL